MNDDNDTVRISVDHIEVSAEDAAKLVAYVRGVRDEALAESAERHARIVRAAEDVARQRNRLWSALAAIGPASMARAAAIIDAETIIASCKALDMDAPPDGFSTWTTRKGERIPLAAMPLGHLKNALELCRRSRCDEWVGPLTAEIERRADAATPRDQLRESLRKNSESWAALPADVRAAVSTKDVFDPAPPKPAASWLTTTCKQGDACRGCAEPDCGADPWALPPPWTWDHADHHGTRWSAHRSTATKRVGVFFDDAHGACTTYTTADGGAPDEVHELVRRRNLAEAAAEDAPAPSSSSLAVIVDDVADQLTDAASARHALRQLAVRLRGAR